MNEDDTYRHLIRTPNKEFLEEVSKLKLYGFSSYSRDFLILYKLSKKHNWAFDEAIQIIVESDCNKAIEDAANRKRDIDSIVKEMD